MAIIHIVGARPQFIKMAAISRAIAAHNNRQVAQGGRIEELIVHTGPHYDENMSAVFFDELQIPKPDCNLGIGSALQGAQTGRMLEAIVYLIEHPEEAEKIGHNGRRAVEVTNNWETKGKKLIDLYERILS